MAKRLLLRDAESISADMLQRLVGGLFWRSALPGGIGTGYAAGQVGTAPTNTTGTLAVTANGSTMVLTILAGWAWVVRDAGGSTFDPRTLMAESDANDTAIVTANATGSTRNDTLCMKIDMASAPTSDGSNLVSFVIIAGAAGGGLSNAPADGNLYFPLANIAVANGATFITQANVTDLRAALIATPGGTLPGGYAQVVANQGPFTAQTDLTGLAVTVNVGSGRRIQITGSIHMFSTVATDTWVFSIREGAATVQTTDGIFPGASIDDSMTIMAIIQPTAGSHTYKLSASRGAGTGNLTMQAAATFPAFILVEDIGI